MDLVEADTDDVTLLAEYWFSLASEMERYDDLNELAVDDPAEARAGFERQLDRDDTTVFLLEAEGTRVGYLTLRTDERPSLAVCDYRRPVRRRRVQRSRLRDGRYRGGETGRQQ